MDVESIRTIVGHLDANGFGELIYFLLKNTEDFSLCKKLDKIDFGLIENPPERFQRTAEAFFINYFPYTIYKDFSLKHLDMKSFVDRVSTYIKERHYDLWVPTDGTTIYSICNYDSTKLRISDQELLKYYEESLSRIIPKSFNVGLGNVNTIINAIDDLNGNYKRLIEKFIREKDDGICISISDSGTEVSSFVVQKEFEGVLSASKTLLHPVIKKINDDNVILQDFTRLINSDCKEIVLEDFLKEHYQLIFGDKYDDISTQLWLGCPELDIGNRDRRIDILMRNSLSMDWELFELKRSNIQLTKTISDVPMFVSAVNDAIAQAKNYKRILSQDSVKRSFEQKGIEYYEPTINLVIGKKPQIPTNQWRRLLSQENELEIITYDMLLEKAKLRLGTVEKYTNI